jgi:hypothetical protein
MDINGNNLALLSMEKPCCRLYSGRGKKVHKTKDVRKEERKDGGEGKKM